MSNFECNSIEDIVFSKSFREWVLARDTPGALFWAGWVNEHPDKRELINHSKAIIYALQGNLKNLSEEEIQAEIQKILKKLNGQEKADEHLVSPGASGRKWAAKLSRPFWLQVAALLVVCLASFLIYQGGKTRSALPNIYDSFIAEKDKEGVTKKFTEDTSQNIQLPDGSTVFLKPGSKLTYSLHFAGTKREVYLTGEAFFNIKRSPSRSFIVYTSSIIAKVLGTSFWVKAYSFDKQAVVTVKKGKVSVYKSSSFMSFSKEQLVSGILVTPNQELVYDKENNELNKSLTEKPALLNEKPRKNMFAFKATPVATVFKTLQDAYGIPIVFDEDGLSACSLSATLGDDPFYDKLNMICKAINASYEMMDGNIIIASQGCK